METTIDARDTVARIAESMRGDAPEAIATLSPGDVVRQGDLYITCLESEPPGGVPAGTRQLAPGEGRGARHVAEGDCDVLRVPDEAAIAALRRVVPRAEVAAPCIGPVLRARGPVTIAHPEHGDRTLPGVACYLVTYQRAWSGPQRPRGSGASRVLRASGSWIRRFD
jgi:hypothetical protein